MTATRTFLAGVLALSLPLAAVAQTAPAAPAADGVKITPYGFLLANAFFTGNTLQANDYPGRADPALRGGALLFSARQSRVGFKFATKEDWSGADITGVMEFDFNAGHVPGNPTCTQAAPVPPATIGVITCTQGAAASTAWYNGLMRLRMASMTATWKTDAGTVSVLAGQDVGIVNTLFAESISWVASPLFWQAGNLWRRSPQFRLSYANTFADIGVNAAVAVLSPATADSPVDFGSGNQSRMPNVEARVGANAKFAGDISGAIGLGYHTNTRRVSYHTANQQDVSGSLIGVDLDLGLTKYAQVKGEFYSGEGADDSYNGIAAATYTLAGAPAGTAVKAQKSSGYWAQLIAKPTPWVWVTLGVGHADADKAHAAAASRINNDQVAGGVIFNAGKAWRFGVEYAQVKTEYLTTAGGAATTTQEATQIAVSSQLKF